MIRKLINIDLVLLPLLLCTLLIISGCNSAITRSLVEETELDKVFNYTSKAEKSWTLRNSRLDLKKIPFGNNYQIIAAGLKKPIKLSIDEIVSEQIFDFEDYSVIILNGKSNETRESGHQIIIIEDRRIRSDFFRTENYFLSFSRSITGKHLLGSIQNPDNKSMFLRVRQNGGSWIHFSQLDGRDKDTLFGKVNVAEEKVEKNFKKPIKNSKKTTDSENNIEKSEKLISPVPVVAKKTVNNQKKTSNNKLKELSPVEYSRDPIAAERIVSRNVDEKTTIKLD